MRDRRTAESVIDTATVDQGDLQEILGARKFESKLAVRSRVPGVATGLAGTPAPFPTTARAPAL
ncbi:MAG: hypothetical protein WED00_01860 [Aquisalimonadaceae bacterium]